MLLLAVTFSSRNNTVMFSTEKLISEVEGQECLWNTEKKSYKDRYKKLRAWEEIGQRFHNHDWISFTAEEKQKKIEQLQKKWKSIRDYYTREKKKEKGNDSTLWKRKKTPYFDKLTFLDHVKEPASSSILVNYLTENATEGSSQTYDYEDLLNETDGSTASTAHTASTRYETLTLDTLQRLNTFLVKDEGESIVLTETARQKKHSETNEESIPHTEADRHIDRRNETHMLQKLTKCLLDLYEEDSKEEDPNKSFLMSLVPEMRKMNERQNFEFRMEIMKALNKIKYQIPL